MRAITCMFPNVASVSNDASLVDCGRRGRILCMIQVPFTLFLHCPKEELKKRLLERGQTSGRADDNVETVLKRFDTFEKESLPVVECLDRLGMVRQTHRQTPMRNFGRNKEKKGMHVRV